MMMINCTLRTNLKWVETILKRDRDDHRCAASGCQKKPREQKLNWVLLSVCSSLSTPSVLRTSSSISTTWGQLCPCTLIPGYGAQTSQSLRTQQIWLSAIQGGCLRGLVLQERPATLFTPDCFGTVLPLGVLSHPCKWNPSLLWAYWCTTSRSMFSCFCCFLLEGWAGPISRPGSSGMSFHFPHLVFVALDRSTVPFLWYLCTRLWVTTLIPSLALH